MNMPNINITTTELDNYIVEKINICDVHEYDRSRFNSCNHGKDKPNDYDELMEKCETKHWITNFKDHYHTIFFDDDDLKWLREAAIICMRTGRFSHLYDENMEMLLSKYEWTKKFFLSSIPYFVRTEDVQAMDFTLHFIPTYCWSRKRSG